MKLIFLDIDGVLNSRQSHHFHIKNKKGKNLKIEDMLCPISTSNLRYILDEHKDCFIVISSTWRKNRTVNQLRKILAKYKIDPKRVIGKTAYLASEIRGKEIDLWLKDHRKIKKKTSHFVIIDDDSDMGTFLNTKHFVQINRSNGLVWTDVDKILKYFGNYTLSFNQLKINKKYHLYSKPKEIKYIFDGKGFYYIDKNGTKHDKIFFYPEHEAFSLVK